MCVFLETKHPICSVWLRNYCNFVVQQKQKTHLTVTPTFFFTIYDCKFDMSVHPENEL